MTLFRLFIYLITVIALPFQLCAEEISEDIIDEWDNKEIEINEPPRKTEQEAIISGQKKRMVTSSSGNKSPSSMKKTPKKRITVKEKTPITRPILYRYIYVNPNKKKLKAEARMKKEARNKELK